MVQCMKENGKMICSMVEVLKLGPINPDMKATMLTVASTVSAVISGTTAANTQVIGARTRSAAWVYTRGSMVDAMKANGSKIIWKAWASTFGTMAESTKANTKTTRSMAMVFIHGLMAAATKDTGTEANNTVLEPTLYPKMKSLNLDCGKMVSA